MVSKAIHEDEAIGEPRERIPQGTLGFSIEFRSVGQSRRHQVGHQLEHFDVGIVEVIRFARHDTQHTQRLSGPDHGRDRDRADSRPPAEFDAHSGVGFGIRAEEGHSDAHAKTRKALFPGVTRSLPIHAQAAHGPVDHDVSLDELHGSPIGVRHRLDPIEDETHHAVGSSRREGIDQTLGLDHVMQQFELGITCESRHFCLLGRPRVTLNTIFCYNGLGQGKRP